MSLQIVLAQVNELTTRMTIVVICVALQHIENECVLYQFENFPQLLIAKMMKLFYWKMVNIRLCV